MNPAYEATLAQLRERCLAPEGAQERTSHGVPCFFVGKTGQFAALVDDHHGDGRLAVWLAAPPGVQESLIAENPEVYFRPPYWGPSGWVGVRLDRGFDWGRVGELVDLAHATIAAKRR